MKILNSKIALYDSQIHFIRTDIAFFPISEISDGAVSLVINVKVFPIGVKVLLVLTKRVLRNIFFKP